MGFSRNALVSLRRIPTGISQVRKRDRIFSEESVKMPPCGD